MDTMSPGNSIVDGFSARLREFRQASGGNVAVTFALAMVPMIGFVGAAIDFSHGSSVKAALQSAADATALMLAKEAASLSSSEMQTKGNTYFKTLFTRPEATGLAVNINYSTDWGPQVTVAATADVKTDFMQMMGFQKMKVGADLQARWGNTRLRVGLVLDNTGSMAQDGKMDALKTATKGLLTQLKNSASQNGDVYVSIVPFSKDVNIGKQFALNSSLLRLDVAAAAYGMMELQQACGALRSPMGSQLELERLRRRPRQGLRHHQHRAERLVAGDAVSGRAVQRLPSRADAID